MIVQITVTDSQLHSLKVFSQQTTASKAVLFSANLAVSLQRSIDNLERQNKALLDDLNTANQIISKLDNACRATLEITGQGDLYAK